MLKNLRAPWRWPTDKAETSRNIKQQITNIVQMLVLNFVWVSLSLYMKKEKQKE